MPFSMRFRCTRMRNVPSTLLFLPVAANADITHHVSPMRVWLAIFWSKGGPSTRGSRSGAPGRRMRPSSAQGEKASLPSEAMAHTPCQTGRFRFDRSTFRCRDMRAHLFSGIDRQLLIFRQWSRAIQRTSANTVSCRRQQLH